MLYSCIQKRQQKYWAKVEIQMFQLQKKKSFISRLIGLKKRISLAVTNEAGESNPKTRKYAEIKLGDWTYSDQLQYGLILSGVTATVTNMVYKDASGNVIYDQNAYYDPMGNAPVADSVTAVAASDRTKIDVSWTGTSARYDGKYILEVLKPGESQWQVVSNNITDKSYEYKVRAGEAAITDSG